MTQDTHRSTPAFKRVIATLHSLAMPPGNTPLRDNPTNSMHIQCYGATGDTAGSYMRSSSDPNADLRVMDTALELFYAVKRGVNIRPETLWRHVMGEEPPFQQPIDMVLYCPNCGKQHIDKDNYDEIRIRAAELGVDREGAGPAAQRLAEILLADARGITPEAH